MTRMCKLYQCSELSAEYAKMADARVARETGWCRRMPLLLDDAPPAANLATPQTMALPLEAAG